MTQGLMQSSVGGGSLGEPGVRDHRSMGVWLFSECGVWTPGDPFRDSSITKIVS